RDGCRDAFRPARGAGGHRSRCAHAAQSAPAPVRAQAADRVKRPGLMRTPRRALLAAALLTALCAALPAAGAARDGVRDTKREPAREAGAHRFGVIGHSFAAPGDERFKLALSETSENSLAFVVVTGIKAAKEPCGDKLYQERQVLVEKAKRPMIVLPAGSDW